MAVSIECRPCRIHRLNISLRKGVLKQRMGARHPRVEETPDGGGRVRSFRGVAAHRLPTRAARPAFGQERSCSNFEPPQFCDRIQQQYGSSQLPQLPFADTTVRSRNRNSRSGISSPIPIHVLETVAQKIRGRRRLAARLPPEYRVFVSRIQGGIIRPESSDRCQTNVGNIVNQLSLRGFPDTR